MNDNLWVQLVDHRISTALILSFLLFSLGYWRRRQGFGMRFACSAVVLCVVNWLIRFVIDAHLVTSLAQGIGYSLHIGVMSLLFMVCHAFCSKVDLGVLLHTGMVAMTIYKLAWNMFKACSSFVYMVGIPAIWSRYSVLGSLVSYLVYFAVCVLSLAMMRFVMQRPPEDLPDGPLVALTAVFVTCQMVLEFCGHAFTASNQALFLYYICALLYTFMNYILLLVFALLVRSQRDVQDMQAFIQNKMQYYQMSYEGIQSLQIKCHDLKHQIAAIRSRVGKESFIQYIDRLEDSIIEYGTVVECGNEAINIVLTEKNILCSTCGVKFSYIIDGTLFGFMTEMEIYSLFGNALDNALESCVKVSDPEKRVIALKAVARGDMVILHVENCYEEEPTIVDGMPVTTKQGAGHGLGLRSIQEIAEKYGGVASVQAEHNIFKLTVLLRPMQD